MDDPVIASAKATEATAKAAGTALEIVHDTGGYLSQIFGSVPEDLVGVLGGDWLHERRIRLRDALQRRTEQILRDRNVREVIELSPNIAAALVTGAQDEGREELMELWARLLANAMDPNKSNVRNSFIDAVRAMDPTDALVLREMWNRNLSRITYDQSMEGTGMKSISDFTTAINRHEDDVEASLRHLFSIGFMDQPSGINPRDWYMNAISREFMRACYPELGR